MSAKKKSFLTTFAFFNDSPYRSCKNFPPIFVTVRCTFASMPEPKKEYPFNGSVRPFVRLTGMGDTKDSTFESSSACVKWNATFSWHSLHFLLANSLNKGLHLTHFLCYSRIKQIYYSLLSSNRSLPFPVGNTFEFV